MGSSEALKGHSKTRGKCAQTRGGRTCPKFGHGHVCTLGTGTQKVTHFGHAKIRLKPNNIAICAQCNQTFQ